MRESKNNLLSILLIIAAWLLALAMVYLMVCKIRLLVH